ncbi:MAG: site-specific integrase [Ignavibacteria bacterium]|nr:site-specific integrase [Ignavibacteria bacterium]
MAQYQRKIKAGIRWWYKFDFKGKTYNSDCIYLSKNEAKRAEADKLKELDQPKEIIEEKPILNLLDAINDRLDYVQNKRTLNYYNDNKRYYSELLNALGNIPVTSIKRKMINEFLFEEAKKAKKAKQDNYAVNYKLNLFTALFNYAIEEHELDIRNPCAGISLFSVKKKLKYIPSDDEVNEVKSICDDEQNLLIDFVADSAARIGEPLKVFGKEIFSEYVILYTRKSKNSNIVPRRVPKPECIKHIQILPNERLFPHWNSTPRFLERKVEKLKHNTWGWHYLRHRRASLWNKEGLSLFEIMSRLGHSNLSTTQKYLQLLG